MADSRRPPHDRTLNPSRKEPGHVEIQLDGGNYELRPTAEAFVRVSLTRNVGEAHVDAAVKAGNIDADAFGRSTGGHFPYLSWSGTGQYSLQATLGAGNLELRRQ